MAAAHDRAGRVVLVEDDVDVRLLTRRSLEQAGWDVIDVGSAGDAIEAAGTVEPDVVLLDLGLPDADGEAVLARLQADPSTTWVPVVVLSARSDPETASRLLLLGAQDYLVKPVRAPELHARLVAARRVAVEQRRVAAAESRHRRLLDHLPDCIVLTFDRNLHVRAGGGKLLTERGYDPDVIVGWSLERLQPADHERLRPYYERGLAGRPVTFDYDHSTGLTFRIRVLPLDGGADGILVFADDITELRNAEAQVAATERRFAAILANQSDLMAVVDREGTIRYLSPSVERVIGRRADDRVGRSVFEFVHPEDLAKTLEAWSHIVRTPGQGPVFEARLWHESGEYRTFEVSAMNRLDDPAVGGIIVTSRDVTDRRRLEDALQETERQFEQVFEHAAIGMTLVEPDGRLRRVNPAYLELLGYTAPELLTKTIFDVTHPDDLAPTLDAFERLISGACDEYQLDKRLRRSDGAWVWVRISASAVRDADGTTLYTIGQLVDISDTKELTERLAHDATHDPLTGLLSRSVLDTGVAQRILTAQRSGEDVALLAVDLDRFKQVNDCFGHALGDTVLVEVAERLSRAVRGTDLLVRLGGDEFVVVLGPPNDAANAAHVAERIVQYVGEPYAALGGRISIGASVGIAMSVQGRTGVPALLAAADEALYRAKAAGRGTYEFAVAPSSSIG